jgi:hypothetical protein
VQLVQPVLLAHRELSVQPVLLARRVLKDQLARLAQPQLLRDLLVRKVVKAFKVQLARKAQLGQQVRREALMFLAMLQLHQQLTANCYNTTEQTGSTQHCLQMSQWAMRTLQKAQSHLTMLRARLQLLQLAHRLQCGYRVSDL